MRSGWVLLGNLLRVALCPLWWLTHWLRRPRARWVELHLQPRLVELPRPRTGWRAWLPPGALPPSTSLRSLGLLVGELSADRGVQGLIVRIPILHPGWAHLVSARRSLERLREAGKQVVAYLPNGGGHRELFLALAADQVVLAPNARLMLLGLSTETFYLKPMLDRLGVQVQVQACGEYKTAAERAVREDMSEAQRRQLKALLGAFQAQLEQAMRGRAGQDAASVAAAFTRGLWSAQDAVEAGLIDARCYEDELPGLLGIGADKRQRPVPAPRYLAHRQAKLWRALGTGPYIALVPVHGVIRGDETATPARAGMTPVMASLRALREDKRALGVILHIDSPGGSALASDMVHREVVRLAGKKPVVALFGEVAASGGYYIACGAQQIVCQPLCVTGSIGVISAKPAAGELFERLGLRRQVVKLAPRADMFSLARPLDASEQDVLERDMRAFYERFLSVVAEGRNLTREQVESLAAGRVWSGQDALGHGLVDKIGGMEVAVAQVRERAGLPADSKVEPRWHTPPKIMPPPAPSGPLGDALGQLEALAALIQDGPGACYYAPNLPVVD